VTTRRAGSRADRLDLIVRRLRDRPGLTAGELARDLGVSARSIFRDLDTLRERGYPLESARGRGGGLRVHPNWGLGRVLFSGDEALCTLLALAISERLGMPMFGPALARARRKIADAFPAAERRRIAPLRERIFVGPPASRSVRASYREPQTATARELQSAFVSERQVLAEYQREDGVVSRRQLEPHALVINWPAWYLMVFDHSRAAPRTLRMDRFRTVQVLAEAFHPRPVDMMRDLMGAVDVRLERV
jgi:predicted DNA-binding transcriptional regulator YafY